MNRMKAMDRFVYHATWIVLLLLAVSINKPSHAEPIHDASENGDLAKLTELIQNNPNSINSTDQFGDTPLLLAAKRGHFDAVNLLLKHGAIVDAKGGFVHDTSLTAAARNGYTEIVRILLDAGADVNAKNDYKETALHLAAEWNKIETAALLLSRGADVNLVDTFGNTPLLKAAIGVSSLNVLTWTLSAKGATETLKILLKKGSRVNAVNNEGETSILRAATVPDVNAMRLLIDYGAKINMPAKSGQTAIHRAAGSLDKEAISLLLSKGASLSTADEDGVTPFIAAAFSRRPDISKKLEMLEFILSKERGTSKPDTNTLSKEVQLHVKIESLVKNSCPQRFDPSTWRLNAINKGPEIGDYERILFVVAKRALLSNGYRVVSNPEKPGITVNYREEVKLGVGDDRRLPVRTSVFISVVVFRLQREGGTVVKNVGQSVGLPNLSCETCAIEEPKVSVAASKLIEQAIKELL